MEKWLLICDESGAKGFNDRPAHNDENIGVVAGILATDDILPTITAELSKLHNDTSLTAKKLHISDIDTKYQEIFRSKVFKIIESTKSIIIYDAASQECFHEKYLIEKKFFETLKTTEKKQGFGYNFGIDKKRLQTVLFLGCLIRSLNYLAKIKKFYNFELELITDTIDDTIASEIQSEISEFLSISNIQSHNKTIVRYNYDKKKTETWSGTIKYSWKMLGLQDSAPLDIKFSMRQDPKISILADVLSNSILHTVSTALANNTKTILTSQNAISSHPLSESFKSLTVDDHNDITKTLYHSILEGKNSFQEKLDFIKRLAVNAKITTDNIKKA